MIILPIRPFKSQNVWINLHGSNLFRIFAPK